MLPETEKLLRSAKKEITRLRRDNETLRAKCDTMEIFAAALGLKEIGQGMGEDLVWHIDKALQNTINERKEVPETSERPPEAVKRNTPRPQEKGERWDS